jgi:hypothetical protein
VADRLVEQDSRDSRAQDDRHLSGRRLDRAEKDEGVFDRCFGDILDDLVCEE